ncbi:diaminobutyrate--2-oxoglutarate transaminase [Agrobacterium vitis]|uniref:Diaminobutyrate--2-oxoglutarate transaminase n=2 Tax=Agrobacterium vitis TaxID=373 RepID=A0AAE4WFF0_AGRVI|nr:diaminobutyrate--2-oxoglutarate transaminase [Allorhizobium sp. Av2]MCM2442298.1 diaminobutyrate--2-oxoglutarate transaminase [Agrobacterium vitis]MUZ58708.1 diaminobutyrate--2-oxoglutarate transaminase [Agrobacterium vitis]MVA66343.1 diaminobutyrate--2-oxoglutarate transaminase [Agrobacterium vitis]MVA88380.1 diaminobutyrate--2-oxoglutarate transaminase [Agrobacterium vitis]
MQALRSVFEDHESNVRTYCRSFPTVFSTARGAKLTDVAGKDYIDLLSGAGTLNYGHNNPRILERVLAYLSDGGIVHSLDMYTTAKAAFIRSFKDIILTPRGLNYKLQFPGPTGTNAVEAALKLARKVTGRSQIVAFSNGFHGMTMGALAATSNATKRAGAGTRLDGVTFMPFDKFTGEDIDSLEVITAMLGSGAGNDAPAAFIVETVQGEGGLNVASGEWLKGLAKLAQRLGALLIIDDIQAGNGRTGTFFSFEPCGLQPDIVVLSKSLSGFGAPLSLVLMKPHLDQWLPGEHNGTFRGNNLAFVGATAALDSYWRDGQLTAEIASKAAMVERSFVRIIASQPPGTVRLKGRELMVGLEFQDTELPSRLSRRLFDEGYIIETCGHAGQVLKLLPPLTIDHGELAQALGAIEQAVLSETKFQRSAA